MANVTVQTRGTVQITGLDADWTLATDLATYANSGLLITSVQFNPSAANDIFILHDGGIDAVVPFKVVCGSSADIKIKYFNSPDYMWPVIDITDCVLTTPANAMVIIRFLNWSGRPQGHFR